MVAMVDHPPGCLWPAVETKRTHRATLVSKDANGYAQFLTLIGLSTFVNFVSVNFVLFGAGFSQYLTVKIGQIKQK